MKSAVLFAVAALASIVVAQEVRRSRPETPSRVNPSQTVPPINPSRTIPPIAPSGTLRPPSPAAPSGRPITAEVFIAITRGLNELRGLPPMDGAGVSVDGLRVETDRGLVVLRGVVGSERDKAEAGARAEAVAGAGKVVNRLMVRP